jgi:hypothetical protein
MELLRGGVFLQLHGVPTFRAVQAVLRREGIRGLYGGVAAAGLGAGCSPAFVHAHAKTTNLLGSFAS